jgi:hypothetical protein
MKAPGLQMLDALFFKGLSFRVSKGLGTWVADAGSSVLKGLRF